MAIYLKDLVENPSLLCEVRGTPARCCGCGVVLRSAITGKNSTPNGTACDDCYYGALGELVDSHPVPGRPHH